MDPLINLSKQLTDVVADIRTLSVDYLGRNLINLLSEEQLQDGSTIKVLSDRVNEIALNMLKTTDQDTVNHILMGSTGLLGQSEITSMNSILTLKIAWLASKKINNHSFTFEDFLKRTKLEPNEQLRVLRCIDLVKCCCSKKQINYPKVNFDLLIDDPQSEPIWGTIFSELFNNNLIQDRQIDWDFFTDVSQIFFQFVCKNFLKNLYIDIPNNTHGPNNVVALKIAWYCSQSLESSVQFDNFLEKIQLDPKEKLALLKFVELIHKCQSREKTIDFPKSDLDLLIKSTPSEWKPIFAQILNILEIENKWIVLSKDIDGQPFKIPVQTVSSLFSDERLNNPIFCNKIFGLHEITFKASDALPLEKINIPGYYLYFTSLISKTLELSFFNESLPIIKTEIPSSLITFFNFFHQYMNNNYLDPNSYLHVRLSDGDIKQLSIDIILADYLDVYALNRYAHMVNKLLQMEKIPWEFIDNLPDNLRQKLAFSLVEWLPETINQLLITNSIDQVNNLITTLNKHGILLDDITFSKCEFTTLNLSPLKNLALEGITFESCSISQDIDLAEFLPNVKKLTLRHCVSFQFSSLNGLIGLTDLQIHRFPSADHGVLIIDRFTLLENLQVTKLNQDMRIINPQKLKSLRSIYLVESYPIPNDFMMGVTQLQSLEDLAFNSCSWNVDENALPQAMAPCPELKKLSIQGLHLNISILKILPIFLSPKLTQLHLSYCKSLNDEYLKTISQKCKLLTDCTFEKCGKNITLINLFEFLNSQKSLKKLTLYATANNLFSLESIKKLSQGLENNILILIDTAPPINDTGSAINPLVIFKLTVEFKQIYDTFSE